MPANLLDPPEKHACRQPFTRWVVLWADEDLKSPILAEARELHEMPFAIGLVAQPNVALVIADHNGQRSCSRPVLSTQVSSPSDASLKLALALTEWTDVPFTTELPRLLLERGLSLRALAREIGINDSHLSRVVRRADYKAASPELTRRIAVALGLPPDYFPEYREAVVIGRIKNDPKLRDSLYRRVR